MGRGNHIKDKAMEFVLFAIYQKQVEANKSPTWEIAAMPNFDFRQTLEEGALDFNWLDD